MNNILLVDDHPVFRCGMEALIKAEPDLTVCGAAESVTKALQLARQLKPDIVITDLNLTGSSGLALIKQLRTEGSTMPILVISMYQEKLFAERVIRAGANGYINKADAITNIIPAIRRLLSGHLYLSPAMMEMLVCSQLQHQAATDAPPESRLTDREMEVFMLVAKGYTTKRIAQELHLSSKTIDSHKEHIKAKLNISDNTSLIQRAVSWMMSI
jgi:DNA-binding NarL/FixJ family response regulator